MAIDCCESHKLRTTDLKSADFSEITCLYVDAHCVIENSIDLINESPHTCTCECNVLITTMFILIMYRYLFIVIDHTAKSMLLSELKLFKNLYI